MYFWENEEGRKQPISSSNRRYQNVEINTGELVSREVQKFYFQ
jgi:hypothetical protein